MSNDESDEKEFINWIKKSKKTRKLRSLTGEGQVRSDDMMQMRFENKKANKKGTK